MDKIRHDPVTVYTITQTGSNLNDDGVQEACRLVFGSDPDGKYQDKTGIMAMGGEYLLDPQALLNAMAGDKTAKIVLSGADKNQLILCTGDPVPVLEQAVKNKTDSWTALMAACGY